MTSQTEVSPKAEKVPNPKAYDGMELATPKFGLWDEVEIGGIDFAYLSAGNLQDVNDICKSNEAKGAQLFNRALRIDIPAKVDARERIKTAKANGTLQEVVAKLQAEILSFDVTTIATRAPRQPTTVTGEDKETYSRAELEEMFAKANVKFVTK